MSPHTILACCHRYIVVVLVMIIMTVAIVVIPTSSVVIAIINIIIVIDEAGCGVPCRVFLMELLCNMIGDVVSLSSPEPASTLHTTCELCDKCA